jgi:hypothetical protein
MDTDPTALARGLLVAVRDGEPTRGLETRLGSLDDPALAAALDTDDARLAFWSNVYNAYAQLLLDRYPAEYEDSRRRFFGHEAIPVAGEWLSLDAVEHGLLRRSQSPIGLGYVPDPFPSAFERRHRLDARDWRIHFALNCGATSCPPIRAYEADAVDAQLDLATRSYLRQEVTYDPETGTATVPRLLLWYRGDFGGGSGIRSILRACDCLPADADPSLSYADYDWSMRRGLFADRSEYQP